MKFSTLIMVCGLVFTQQAFAQNNVKNTSDCHSNNTKGCTTTNSNACWVNTNPHTMIKVENFIEGFPF